MSQNQTPPAGSGPIVKDAISQALDDFGAELQRSCETIHEQGKGFSVNVAQLFVDVQVQQLKLEAIFEELGAERLIDPAQLSMRFLRKLDREAKSLKQRNDARLNSSVASAVNTAISDRGGG